MNIVNILKNAALQNHDANTIDSEETFTMDNKTNLKMNTDFLMSIAKANNSFDQNKENRNISNIINNYNNNLRASKTSNQRNMSVLENSMNNELPKINCKITDIESESDDVTFFFFII